MKTIKIKDYYGIYQEIPVSDELYEEWRALQNETQRIHRKEVYHRDWTPMDDLEEMPQHFTLNELEDALIWDEQVVELYRTGGDRRRNRQEPQLCRLQICSPSDGSVF